jgi:hypothetical protein
VTSLEDIQIYENFIQKDYLSNYYKFLSDYVNYNPSLIENILSVFGNIIHSYEVFQVLYESDILDKMYMMLKQRNLNEGILKTAIWVFAISGKVRPALENSEYVMIYLI